MSEGFQEACLDVEVVVQTMLVEATWLMTGPLPPKLHQRLRLMDLSLATAF